MVVPGIFRVEWVGVAVLHFSLWTTWSRPGRLISDLCSRGDISIGFQQVLRCGET